MSTALTQDAIVAVIGAGTMGAGIAQVAAQAGHQVWLVDQNHQVLDGAVAKLANGLEKLVGRGKITTQEATATINRIKTTTEQQDLAGSSLIIEAIIENQQIKQQLFANLMAICGADCIYASNTSSIPIADIAEGLDYPQQMVGMHFFNPAQIMKLVEVISSTNTKPEVATCVYDTATAWHKVAVHATDTPGFIVNRVARPFYAEALRMVSEGMGDYPTIDTLLRQAGGFRMGPFELMDLIGHDVNYAVTELVSAALGHPLFETSAIQKALVDNGHLGRKSGQGYYDYSQDLPKLENLATPDIEGELTIAEKQDGILATLLTRLSAAGVSTSNGPDNRFNGVRLCLHNGAPVAEQAEATVALDIALDFDHCTALACQRNNACSDEQLAALSSVFAAAGIHLIELPNQAGLPVARTVAMLANVAADAVANQVCSVEDADKAMRFGVNYPQGPFIWADQIGVSWVHATLSNLAQHICSARYAPSPWIAQHLAEQRNFHD